jgi:hypothetical protein
MALIRGGRKLNDRISPHSSHYSLKGITGNRNFENFCHEKLALLLEALFVRPE